MSFNGSGTFLINTAGQPVVSGTVISSTAFNALTADLATGLSTAITKDGQTTVTANIPMSTYKFTGLGVGSAATDSANLSQVQSTVTKLLTSVSGTDTITAVGAPVVAAYAAGQMFYFVATGDNTGAVTLNIDSLGAKAVTRDGSVALAAGDIKSGEVVVVVYDGTRFQVVSQLNSAGNATFANVSITSALNVGGVATFTANPVLSGGTANGVLYLNGSKVATSGSAFAFNGTDLTLPAEGYRSSATSFLRLSGGDGAGSGANLLVFGQTHATAPGRAVLTATGTGYLQLATFGGAATLDSSGNLGIGTASPVGRVDSVSNASSAFTARASTTGANQTATVLNVYNSDASLFALAKYNAVQHIWGYAGATEGMRLDSSGNLGIGTASPSFRLTASYTAPATFTNASSDFLQMWQASGTNAIGLALNTTGTVARFVTNNGYVFAWNNASSEFMRLDGSGNLGIGTASPASKLTVSGDVHILSTNYLNFTNTAQQTYIRAPASNTIAFGTSSTEQMRLDSSGNLGLGTSSPNRKLEVNGISRFTDGTSNVEITNGGGVGYIGPQSNHPLAFQTNNAERARLTSGGDLLVGTSATGGSASNATRVTGGIFSTFNATPSIASGTATTVATLPSGEGMYLVSASLLNSGTAADWNELALVRVSQSNTAVSTIVGAANLDITVSGLNVQVTQFQGATQTIPVAIIRLL